MSRVGTGPASFLSYEAVGEGMALIALHGAYSSRVEVRGFLEPMVAGRPIRRIYVDLPGHGASRPSGGVTSPDDALDLLDLVLDAEAPGGGVLLLGHSFGAHFARTVAARHPARVAGLALFCPYVDDPEPADSVVVRDDGVSEELDADRRAEFDGYFVVRTAATLEAFRRSVVPASGPVDEETLERAIGTGPLRVDPGAVSVTAPTLIVTARNDNWVGWRRQRGLADSYPHATAVLVDGAGHALPHEHPRLIAALLDEWLERASTGASA